MAHMVDISIQLGALKVKPLTGSESFFQKGESVELRVSDFWRWAYSNLVANNLRGYLAEFLVGSDLGVISQLPIEWSDHDLLTKTGIKVEVKSAAYLQSWNQSKRSSISFGIAPARSFNSVTGRRNEIPTRSADVYVFCLLAHKDKSTLDPTNLEQWQFYVLATRKIDAELGNQETLSLNLLLKLQPIQCVYGEISRTIDELTKESSDAVGLSR